MPGQWLPPLIGGAAGLPGVIAAYVLGGRRRAKADARQVDASADSAVVEAATEAVELVRSIVRNEVQDLRAEVTSLRVAAVEAERRAEAAEKRAELLTSAMVDQRAAASRLVGWVQRAAPALRAAGIAIEDPPELPDLLIPTHVDIEHQQRGGDHG